MGRIDRARLDAAVFPESLEVATRWDDLDMQGHVNNVSALVLLQEGRARFNRASGLPILMAGLRTMVASITVEYAAELHHPDPVTVQTGVLSLGRTSFTLAQRAEQGGRAALYALTVLVLANEAGPAPLPERLREAYERLRV